MRFASRWWIVGTVMVAAAIAAVEPGRPLFGEPKSDGSVQGEIPVPSAEPTPSREPIPPGKRTSPRKRTRPATSPESIARWVAELDDDRYAVRAEATRQLIDAGAAAVGPVYGAASTGSLEASTRALTILESVYGSVDEESLEAYDLVEQALERLADSSNGSVAARAVEVLELHDGLRETRAIASIRRLGGIVRLAGDDQPRNMFSPDARRAIGPVIIPRQWRGGDEGLRHVQRLSRLMTLIRITGNQVSDKGIRDLQTAIPNLTVDLRGPASLGITRRETSQIGDAWAVDGVDPESSAARGGIRAGDVITRFAGKDVPNFNALIELIKKTKPGDEVEVVVQRQARQETLKVVMQEWRDAEK